VLHFFIYSRAVFPRRALYAAGSLRTCIGASGTRYHHVEAQSRRRAHVASRAVLAGIRGLVHVLPHRAGHFVPALLVDTLEPGRALLALSGSALREVVFRALLLVLVRARAEVACWAHSAMPLAFQGVTPLGARLDGVEGLLGAVESCWTGLELGNCLRSTGSGRSQ